MDSRMKSYPRYKRTSVVQMCALDLEMGQGKGKREMNPKQRKKKEIKKKIFSGIQCRQHCA